eukprot:gene12556-8605_t
MGMIRIVIISDIRNIMFLIKILATSFSPHVQFLIVFLSCSCILKKYIFIFFLFVCSSRCIQKTNVENFLVAWRCSNLVFSLTFVCLFDSFVIIIVIIINIIVVLISPHLLRLFGPPLMFFFF